MMTKGSADGRSRLKDTYREFGLKLRLAAPFLGRYVRFIMAREDRRLRHGWTYEPPTFCEVIQGAAAAGAGQLRQGLLDMVAR